MNLDTTEPAGPAPGRYRHYKGGEYTVIGLAIHSESGEWLVVYRPEYSKKRMWVRPLAMFMENIVVDGVTVPRFTRMTD